MMLRVKSLFVAFARQRVLPAFVFYGMWFFVRVLGRSVSFPNWVILPVSRFCIAANLIVKLAPLAVVFLVMASGPQACHNIGRYFGGVVLPAVFSASPQKHFSRLLVFSASHAV